MKTRKLLIVALALLLCAASRIAAQEGGGGAVRIPAAQDKEAVCLDEAETGRQEAVMRIGKKVDLII